MKSIVVVGIRVIMVCVFTLGWEAIRRWTKLKYDGSAARSML